jgi:hypothetical protein
LARGATGNIRTATPDKLTAAGIASASSRPSSRTSSFAGGPQLEEIGEYRLRDHGVRICLMQGADSMYENFARRLIGDIRMA